MEEKPLPKRPALWTLLGPAFVWAAVAQGSGELIWWPYFASKYGLALVGLLLPASFFQFFVNQEVARYTALTGEGIWSGFKKVSRAYTFFLFILAFVCFLWFGGYASAGGTALYSLTGFPAGWGEKAGSLFWGYLSIFVFCIGLFFSKVVYRLIENFMKIVIGVTFAGLVVTVFHPEVWQYLGEFLKAVLNPFTVHLPANWDPKDAPNLVTGIAYAGMGGFLNLMYSYWMRDKGVGMAKYFGKVTGLFTSKAEEVPAEGFVFGGNEENRKNWREWLRYLKMDNFLAIFLNTLTLAMTTFLGYAVLHMKGEYPSGWKIAVVQARFFEVSFGTIGKAVFLVAAAFFLVDTWLGLADGIARQFADFTYTFFSKAKKKSFRFWYYVWLVWLVGITSVTMPLAQPGVLINIAGVISIFAFVLFIPLLWRLNFYILPEVFPSFTRPRKATAVGLGISWIFYLAIAIWFLKVTF